MISRTPTHMLVDPSLLTVLVDRLTPQTLYLMKTYFRCHIPWTTVKALKVTLAIQ